MNKFSIWAGGFSRRVTAGDPPEHLQHLGNLGTTVGLAALVASINWAAASTSYTDGLAWELRVGIAAACAAIGATIVLIVDRTMLFALDIRGVRGALGLFAAVRVALILVVGSFTAEAALPLIMGQELEQHALYMREHSEAERLQVLSARHQLRERTQAVATAAATRNGLEADARVIPLPIRRALATASNCWGRYTRERRRLVGIGVDERSARLQLRGKASACSIRQRQAKASLAAYRAMMANRVAEAATREKEYGAVLASANNAVATRMASAGAIEAGAIRPGNSVVLWDLITSNPGALIKVALFMLLLVLVETLPLTTKLLAGRSATGVRVGTLRERSIMDHEMHLALHRNDCRVALAVSEAMADAMMIAMQQTRTNAFMQSFFLKQAQAMAPMEAAKWTLRNIERDQQDVDAIVARSPRLASVIAAAWSQAVRQTTDILNST